MKEIGDDSLVASLASASMTRALRLFATGKYPEKVNIQKNPET